MGSSLLVRKKWNYDQKKRAGSDQLLETMVLATTALLQPIFINATRAT